MSNESGIEYVVGDATTPQRPSGESAIIVHVCNDGGGWGRGFVLALSAKWPAPEAEYRAWHAEKVRDGVPFELGGVLLVPAEEDIFVANLVGQHGTRSKKGVPPVRYDAIATGLARVGELATQHGASVHMPRIGCGLAGGTWEHVGAIVEEQLVECGVRTVVYDLPARES